MRKQESYDKELGIEMKLDEIVAYRPKGMNYYSFFSIRLKIIVNNNNLFF